MFDLAGGLDEVNCVIVVFFNTGSYCKDVGVEDYVVRLDAHFFGEDLVRAFANRHFPFDGVSLPLLILVLTALLDSGFRYRVPLLYAFLVALAANNLFFMFARTTILHP